MIFKITFKHLLSKPVSTLLTIMAVAMALTMLGTFWTVVENLERVRFEQQSKVAKDAIPGLTLFVDARLSAAEVESLRQKILENKLFSDAVVVSSKDAYKALEQQFGEALSKAFSTDALPVTLKLSFARSTLTRQELVNLLNGIRSLPGVLDLDDGLSLGSVSNAAVSKRVFSWATALLIGVFLVVALLVSHLIRLAFESLRTEIETMKVIGAPNFWILAPLLLDGLVLGLGGSVVALGALVAVIRLVIPRVSQALLPAGVNIVGLSPESALMLVTLGLGAAMLGALFTWPLVKRPPQEI
jgi:cell division transport system permease protein